MPRSAPRSATAVRHRNRDELDLLRTAELGRRTRELRALGEIVQQITQSVELDQVFSLIARHATDLLDALGARLGMLDGDEFVIVAAHGAVGYGVGERVPVRDAFCGEAARSRRPLRTAALERSADRWTWTAAHVPAGSRDAIAVPLLVGDRVIGAMTVFGKPGVQIDQQAEELLMTLASHAAVAIENARLYRSSLRTTRHASILATLARSLALNVTSRAMWADMARIARASLGADGVGIYLADPLSGNAQLSYTDGAGGEVTTLATEMFWQTRGGIVVRSGLAEYLSDLASQATGSVSIAMQQHGITSVACLPLVVEGKPRGLLSLRYRSRQSFDADQRQLLTDFATHAAVAMRNALLFADLDRRAGRLAAVARLQQEISATTSLEAVYAAVHRAVAMVVDAPCFALFLPLEEDGALFPCYVASEPPTAGAEPAPPVLLDAAGAAQARRLAAPSVSASLAAHLAPSSALAVVLSVPIMNGDEVLGVLQASAYRDDAYGWEDVDLVMLLAQQAGTAISTARSFEAERWERGQAEAAAAIARIALSATGVDVAASELLAIVAGAVPAAGSALYVAAGRGSPLRQVARCGELRAPAAVVHDADDDGIPSQLLPGFEGTVVPLHAGKRLIGVLGADLANTPDRAASVAALWRLSVPLALALATLTLREEERHQQARQRMLAGALATMTQPVIVRAPDGAIRFANAAALREFQYAEGELVGRHMAELAVQSDDARDLDLVNRAVDRFGAWKGDGLCRRRDGSEFPAQVLASPVRGDDGVLTGVVAVIRNLSEEQRVAEQLRQSERLMALGELVAGVAHEVNNPLTGISAFAQLLQDDSLNEEQREAVVLIKREADRAVTVIRDLLTFARKTGPRTVQVDMNSLIEQTLRLRTYALRTAGIQLSLALEPTLHRVEGDDRQLQQVLLNLVVNAEHAMAAATERTLSICTTNEFDRVVVTMSDTGCGMPADVQRRIFEPFFTTKPEGKGTGLGLSVSYGIVQTHGGTLTVQSTPGAGTTFRVSLCAERDP